MDVYGGDEGGGAIVVVSTIDIELPLPMLTFECILVVSSIIFEVLPSSILDLEIGT